MGNTLGQVQQPIRIAQHSIYWIVKFIRFYGTRSQPLGERLPFGFQSQEPNSKKDEK